MVIKNLRRMLINSIISLFICIAMLTGSTYAWFSAVVSSENNVIQTGSLDVGLYYKDPSESEYRDASVGKIFTTELWEPGYIDVKQIKIENFGSLTLQYKLSFGMEGSSEESEIDLADVIDVYVFDADEVVDREIIKVSTPIGTLAQAIESSTSLVTGVLLPEGTEGEHPIGSVEYYLVLAMREGLGSEYQNLSVGDGISVKLMATQYFNEAEHIHSYTSSIIRPDCKNDGYTAYVCSCGDSYTDTYVKSTEKCGYVAGICSGCGNSVLGSDWLEPEFADGDYSMVILPDTQIIVEKWPDSYYDLCRWVAAQRDTLNIQAVLHMGDMVNVNNDAQWTVCKNGTDIIDSAGIPWMPMMGNHDDSAWFNKYYDYAAYGTDKSWFGGSYYADKLDHTYWFVTVGQREYMILSLGWAPSWEVLEWAQGIVEQNDDKSVILTCHAYMNSNGSLLGTYKTGYPGGQDIWDAFSSYDNIALAMGGHVHNANLVTWVGQNGAGKDVTSLLADRQNDDVSNYYSMAAVLTFHADSDTVDINWYSSRYDALYKESNQFSITVPHVCEHQYVSSGRVEATCTVGEGIRYVCELCDDSYVEELSAPLGHTMVDVSVSPTCTEEGYSGKTCTVCGYVMPDIVELDITDRFVWSEGKIVSATSGSVSSDSNWVASDYVDISEFESIEIITADTVNAGTSFGLAFYDADKKYVSGVLHTDKQGSEYGVLVHNIEIPEGAVYIRTTWYSENHSSYPEGVTNHTFYCKGYGAIVPALGHSYEDNVCTVCGYVMPDIVELDITDRFVWSEGKIVSATSGSVSSDSNWVASDYVDISEFESIEIITADTVNAGTSFGLAFYDADKKYVSGVLHTDKQGSEYGVLVHNIEIPEGAVYIRTTWYSKNHSSYPEGVTNHTFYCKGYGYLN